jgi:hypothetical protein
LHLIPAHETIVPNQWIRTGLPMPQEPA